MSMHMMPDGSSWTVRVSRWTWTYTFSVDKNFSWQGTVSWKDPFNGKTAKGFWRIERGKLVIRWLPSTTEEKWNLPLHTAETGELTTTGEYTDRTGPFKLTAETINYSLEYAIQDEPFPHPEVNTRLPDDGPGFTTHDFVSCDARWGLPETVASLQAIAAMWKQAINPDALLNFGDISLEGGGKINGHDSHQKGVDADVWPVGHDGNWVGVKTFKDPRYSQTLTQVLVNYIRTYSKLDVQFILFNDPEVTGVSHEKGHDDHLHIRYREPPSPKKKR